MKMMCRWLMVVLTVVFAGCAVKSKPLQPTEAPVSKMQQVEAQKALELPPLKGYKRKIIIGRFSNETNYGKVLLTDENNDRIGKQASDMLAGRLIKSNRFIVLERPDLNVLNDEKEFVSDTNFIGTDAIIVGAVTEFGRVVTGKSGFLSSTKMQTAKARVEIRLVDARTGHAFFSATGAGESSTETGDTAGFGSQADYDATLNDRAISAAVSDVIDKLISTIENRPWQTDVLDIQGNQVFISGGKSQGIKVGDTLTVFQKTKTVNSKQSGFAIDLPPKKIGMVKVVSLFGDTETNEGAVTEISEGAMDISLKDQLFIREGEE